MEIIEINERQDPEKGNLPLFLQGDACTKSCQGGAWDACFHNTNYYGAVYWMYHDVDLTVYDPQ